MWSYLQYRKIGRQITEQNKAKSDKVSDQSSPTEKTPSALEHGEESSRGGLSKSQLERCSPSADSEKPEKEKKSTNAPHDRITVRTSGEHDPLDPQNWSLPSRCKNIAILSFLIFSQGWAGAAGSMANSAASKEFHVSKVAENLSTAMYLFGIGSGALFVGPLSETVGRNPTYLVATAFYLLFLLGSALTPNFGGQVVCRYLVGLFSSATLAINGSSVRDQFRPVKRAFVFPIIAWANVAGKIPLLLYPLLSLISSFGYSSCYSTCSRRLHSVEQGARLALDRVGDVDHLWSSIPRCALILTRNIPSNPSRLESEAPSPYDRRLTIYFRACSVGFVLCANEKSQYPSRYVLWNGTHHCYIRRISRSPLHPPLLFPFRLRLHL